MLARSISQLRLVLLLSFAALGLLGACDGGSESASPGDSDLGQRFVCAPGIWACADLHTRGVCDEYGAGFMDTEACASGLICVGGICAEGGSTICEPGAYSCYDERSRWHCRDDGLDFEGYEICPDGVVCQNGTCGSETPDGDHEAAEDEATTETPTESELEPVTEAESEPANGDLETEAALESEPEAETDASTEADGDPDPEPEREAEREADPEPQVDGDPEPQVDGDPEPEVERDADTDTDVPPGWIFSDCLPKSGDALWGCLRSHLLNNKSCSYDGARKHMYGEIDYVNGKVQCVYTGAWFSASTSGSTPSGMNCEHTWPQGSFGSASPMVCDLNHLYPTESTANNRRSSYPFGYVVSDIKWQAGGSKLGKDSAGRTVYEVRNEHKGDTARAIFYFAVRYESVANAHPWVDENVLRQWSHDDPPDDSERARNEATAKIQGTRNPFVDHPEFADAIPNFTSHVVKSRKAAQPTPAATEEVKRVVVPWWQEGLLEGAAP